MTDFDQVPVVCAALNFQKATRVITQLFNEELRPSGLRVNQFALLVAILLYAPVTIGNLADELIMDRTSLSRNLKPLEKRNLILIEVGKDRRTRRIKLSGRGRQALEEALPLWEKAQAQVLKGLGSERYGKMLRELASIPASLG